MDPVSGKNLPPMHQGFPTDHDLKSLKNVERHLLVSLEIERVRASRPASRASGEPVLVAAGIERRINRHMNLSECFPDGRLALRGRLSELAPTIDKRTYRAYLRSGGNVITVLYINFELGTCLTSALVPKLAVLAV